MLHGHGDDGYRFGQPIRANFSSNVWYGADPAPLREHLIASWDCVLTYPEAAAESLRSLLAEREGLPSESVLVCNGATEAIYLTAQAFAGSASTVAIPAFSEYEDACRLNGHHLHFLPRQELGSDSPIPPGLLWTGQPGNPDGRVLPPGALEAVLDARPDVTVVLDEAYIELTRAAQSARPLLEKHPNLLLLRSLTKRYRIPGLRLGYVLGRAETLRRVATFRPPWTVNSLASEAGRFLLSHPAHSSLPLDLWLEESRRLSEAIATLPGFLSQPSHSPFFLCQLQAGSSSELKEWLISRHGLLIRDASNFRGLGPGHFRLCAQDRQSDNSLLEALRRWTSRN